MGRNSGQSGTSRPVCGAQVYSGAEARQVLRTAVGDEADGSLSASGGGARIRMLQGPEPLYRMIVENMTQGAVTLTRDGVVRYCNPCFSRMLARNTDQVVGRAFHEFLPPSEHTVFARLLVDSLCSPARADSVLQAATGESFSVQLAASAFDHDHTRGICLVVTNLQEIKHAQQALLHREQQFQSLINCMSEGFLISDADGRIIYANKRLHEMLGCPLDTILREVPWSLLDARNQAVLCKQLALRRQGRPGTYELDWSLPDGRPLSTLVSAQPLRGPLGRYHGACAVLMDITERKAAETRIRSLANFLDEDPMPVLRVSLNGVLMYANPASAPIVKDWQCRVGQRVPDDICQQVEQCLVARTTKESNVRCNGSIFAFTYAPLPEKGYTNIYAKDITLQAMAREALRKSEEKYRSLIQNLHDIIFSLDEHGRITFISEAVLRIGGYRAEDMLGRHFGEFVHPDDLPGVDGYFKAVLSGQPQTYEARWLARSGDVRHLQMSCRCLQEASSRYVLGVATDITEQVQTEQALRKSERALQHAQKMQAIGLLAGGVAHDFRNQLTVINGYAELLLESGLDKAEREYVQEILAAADRAASLTGELLTFGRRQILHPKTVSLNQAVEQIGRTVQSLLGEDIALRFELSPRLGMVQLDVGLFQQAIVNLATNARDAMPNGGELVLRTANVDVDASFSEMREGSTPGRYVSISISDTGTGMSPETLSQIWEPFYTTKPEGHGTGLGLSSVYGFVRQSGGFVDVQNELGCGSTFRLYFPRVSGRRAKARSTKSGAPSGASRASTVLVAEDEEPIRRLLGRVLRTSNYEVIDAADGQEALDLAHRCGKPIDLLVTDVVMPGMSGADLARQIQSLHPGIRVLYMSGYMGEVLSRRGVNSQGTPLLLKPFHSQEILKAVRKALRHNPAAA